MNTKNYISIFISLILILITLQAKSGEADKLPVVIQELVSAPLVPTHNIVAKGGPKVIKVRMSITEKVITIDKQGTKFRVFAFNDSVPGPLIVAHVGDYIELTLVNPKKNYFGNYLGFSATKGALDLVTEAASMEVKNFGIKVINVAPGDFATNIAAGRYHTPVFEKSAYKQKYQANLDLMDSHVEGGMDPLEMAKTVYKIINTKNPKIHYKVGGFMEKFSIVLKRILSDRMYEKILMNHYKL
mgnify:CR=1 FL=1